MLILTKIFRKFWEKFVEILGKLSRINVVKILKFWEKFVEISGKLSRINLKILRKYLGNFR